VSCDTGCRCGLDPDLLRLWRRPVATALIRPLAWEPPYAVGVAQEMAKKKKDQIVTWVQQRVVEQGMYREPENNPPEWPDRTVTKCDRSYLVQPTEINQGNNNMRHKRQKAQGFFP